MSDKQELNMEEMGQVAGGWTFHSNGKYHTWLDGYEIRSSIHMRCLREVFLPPLGQSQQKSLPR